MPSTRRSRSTRARSKTCLVWILPDQLLREHPALVRAHELHARESIRVILVESRTWLHRHPYHKKRLVLHLSAGRHYAEELRSLGYEVEVLAVDHGHEALATAAKRHDAERIVCMAAADFDVHRWQADVLPTKLDVPLEILPTQQFLIDQYDPIPRPAAGRRYVMENFYRAMRKQFGLLIEPDASPSGGAWNFDAENRRPLPPRLDLPELPQFPPDSITAQVIDEVRATGFGVGSIDGFAIPVTRADSQTAFEDFLEHRLPNFGPYEDAMSRRSGVLFHSLLSPQMNLGLLDPLEMCRRAEAEFRESRAPINSVEGFVRQIIGWREFIAWQYRRQMPDLRAANSWDSHRPMPRLFWDGGTSMNCLRTVVGRLLETGFSHHIERLMLVCNFCLLAGVDPSQVADWFLALYVDSHDWVVLPNVIGMGLNADDGITATKPYIASAAYVNKMSDYCGSCDHNPKARTGADACPFNTLYWNFLVEHEARLRSNPRLGPNVLGLRHLSPSERKVIRQEAATFLDAMEPYTD